MTNFATVTTNFVIYATNSITVVTTNFVSRDITGLDVVNKVSILYSSVFNHFLVMMGIMGAVVGGVIPVLLERKQRREGRLQEDRFNAEFKAQMAAAKSEYDSKFASLEAEKKIAEQALQDTEVRIEKKLKQARGTAFHVRASTHMERNNYVGAVRMGAGAIQHYLDSDDEDNLGRVIRLVTRALTHLNKEQIEKGKLADRLSKLETEIKEFSHSGSLSEDIEKFVKIKNEALIKK